MAEERGEDGGQPDDKLTLITWNMNGVRSFDDFQDRITNSNADIICIQETKVTRDMLTESIAVLPDFSSYFSFSRLRSGYSGVATYCRTCSTPAQAQSGLTQGEISAGWAQLRVEFSAEELKSLDSEGRCVITRHKVSAGGLTHHLTIINVYCPRADPEKPDREKYKLQFYKALDIRANCLREAGDLVIVCGDVNTSHRQIDHCDPYEEFEDNPGRRFLTHFLREPSLDKSSVGQCQKSGEEASDGWLSENIEVAEHQFVDTFRIFHPDREMAFTCWNTKMNCRANNYGTRIDYILASGELAHHLSHCDIEPEVEGSDHCPVRAELALRPLPALKPPESCTKYFKEFSGKQVKLSQFFTKAEKPVVPVSFNETKPPPAKRQKVEGKTKITSFFSSQNPKPNIQPPSKQAEQENGGDGQPSQPREKPADSVNNNAKAQWGNIFKPPPPPPLCNKHREEAVRRKVTKKGPNTGREFWCCSRGEGRADDPQARCDFFKWVK